MALQRRQFLQFASSTSLALASPQLLAAPSLILPKHNQPSEEYRALKLRNLHTGENIHVTYWEQGDYLIDGLAEIYYLMRDHRRDAINAIDLDLLDQLHSVQKKLDSNREIMVISGFRHSATNASLRERSNHVAEHSLHMQGRAMDFRIPGINHRHLHKATLAATHGGVGYYRSGYVHIDTGRKRRWYS